MMSPVRSKEDIKEEGLEENFQSSEVSNSRGKVSRTSYDIFHDHCKNPEFLLAGMQNMV